MKKEDKMREAITEIANIQKANVSAAQLKKLFSDIGHMKVAVYIVIVVEMLQLLYLMSQGEQTTAKAGSYPW